LREGFRYVASRPQLGIPLLMMGLVGCLAYEFQVTLPVFAKGVFHGGPEIYGLMTAAMGVGAVVGGLITAARGKTGMRAMVLAAVIFGVMITFAAVSPVLAVAIVALALVGYASVSFLAMGNSTLQLATDPQMRGRVMALWSVAFLGSTPIGGPAVGWIISRSDPRVGLAVGGVTCLVAATFGLLTVRWLRDRRRSERVAPSDFGAFDKATGGPVAIGGTS
jgi:MFS family permease